MPNLIQFEHIYGVRIDPRGSTLHETAMEAVQLYSLGVVRVEVLHNGTRYLIKEQTPYRAIKVTEGGEEVES